MRRSIIMAALSLAAICAFSATASAQRGRVGNHSGTSGFRSPSVFRGGNFGGYGGFRPGPGLGSSFGSPYGYSGGYGYHGGYAPSYSSTYGFNTSNYVPPTTYAAPPSTFPDPSDSSRAGTSANSSRRSRYHGPELTDDLAHLRILVPADATVWVEGELTTPTGEDRRFSSPPLTPGKGYTYEVKARWMAAGVPVEQTRKVRVHPNQTTTVDFAPVAEIGK